MRPCRFYALNKNKDGFVCEYEAEESALYFRIMGNKDFIELNTYCNKYCPRIVECVSLCDETYRSTHKANIIVNRFADGSVSVLKMKKPFAVTDRVINDKSDKSRAFVKINMDFLFPRKKQATLTYLHKNIYRAGKRAKDAFWGFAKSNIWSYFFTFTFSPHLVLHRDKAEFTNALWSKFQRKLKCYDKDIKIANVPENHKDGAQHFHAFITFSEDLPVVDYGDISKLPQRECEGGRKKGKKGFCTFTKEGRFTYLPDCKYKYFLVPYYEFGELQLNSLGDVLFCLNTYPYGINSCAILPGDETNQSKVSAYCAKYLTKESNLGYNKKRFMRTRNLLNKQKETMYLDEEQFALFCQDNNLYMTDKKARFEVYRNYGDKFEDKPPID